MFRKSSRGEPAGQMERDSSLALAGGALHRGHGPRRRSTSALVPPASSALGPGRWERQTFSARWVSPVPDRMMSHTTDGTETVSVGHCKRDDVDVYIGRGPNGGAFGDVGIGERGWLGNPFTVEEYGRQGCIERFEVAFVAALESTPELREEVAQLAGETLGCWCRTVDECGPACHGDVIAKYAELLAHDS